MHHHLALALQSVRQLLTYTTGGVTYLIIAGECRSRGCNAANCNASRRGTISFVPPSAAGHFGKCGTAANTRNLCIYDPAAQAAYPLVTAPTYAATSSYQGIRGAVLVGTKLYMAADSAVYGYQVVSSDISGWTTTAPVSGYTAVGSGSSTGVIDWIIASPQGDRLYVGTNGETDACLQRERLRRGRLRRNSITNCTAAVD